MFENNPGRFVDEWTIHLRKAILYPEECLHSFVASKYDETLKTVLGFIQDEDRRIKFINLTTQLMMRNTDIWNLESDVRKGNTLKLGLEEIGRRTLLIRDINKERISLVNEINDLFGLDIVERKFDHGSAEKET